MLPTQISWCRVNTLSTAPPMSRTVVTPLARKSRCIQGPHEWIWVSIKLGMTYFPAAEMTWAPAGADRRSPICRIRFPSMSIVVPARGVIRSGMDMFLVGLGVALVGYLFGDLFVRLLS